MNMRIKFVKDWISPDGTSSCKTGDVATIDEERAKQLMVDETAIVWSDSHEKLLSDRQGPSDKQVDLAIDKAIEKHSAEFAGDRSQHNIEVGAERKPLDKTDGYKCLAEWAADVVVASTPGAKANARLNVHEKAVGSDEMSTVEGPYGGYWLMPTQFSTEILQVLFTVDKLLSRVTPIPIDPKAGSIEFGAVDQTALADGQMYGGVTTVYRDELDQMTGSRPKGSKVKLELHECYTFMYVTNKMVKRSPVSIGALFNTMAVNSIRRKTQKMLIQGTGAGQPRGILNSPAKVSVAKETNQAAGTILTENVHNMYARLFGDIRDNAVWMFNQQCEPQLLQMVLVVGTAGVPMYVPAGGISGKPYNTLLGLPAFPIMDCKGPGTEGDLILCDWGQYLFGQPAGPEFEIATSIHVRFDYGEECFRILHEHDGQCWWKSAFTPAEGTSSETLSCIVTLAARA